MQLLYADSISIATSTNPKLIETFFQHIKIGATISRILFFDVATAKTTLEIVKKRRIIVRSFEIVADDINCNNAYELMLSSLDWWWYCNDTGREPEYSSLRIGGKIDTVPDAVLSLLRGLSYFCDREKEDSDAKKERPLVIRKKQNGLLIVNGPSICIDDNGVISINKKLLCNLNETNNWVDALLPKK